MRVAVDAVGGDYGARVVVPGAVLGAKQSGVGLAFVGPTAAVQHQLDRLDVAGLDLTIVEAPEEIGMAEHPAQAVRRKRQSSIVVGIREVKLGRADAFVSAGNSGAVLAAALLDLGTIEGIERPAIATSFPTVRGSSLFLDLGAVTDPRPQFLVQYALMGRVYAEEVLGVANPTIGLLSNGEEPTKGTRLVQEVFGLLSEIKEIDFRGNIEGKDLTAGTVDVVVTDGFTGNVALKTAEGTATMLIDLLRRELSATLPRRIASALLRPALRCAFARLDYTEIGGAPLLGVNGAVIIAHGRSSEKAIANAVGVARRSVEVDVGGKIRELVRAATSAASVEPVDLGQEVATR